jgi:hypothetical protein
MKTYTAAWLSVLIHAIVNKYTRDKHKLAPAKQCPHFVSETEQQLRKKKAMLTTLQ